MDRPQSRDSSMVVQLEPLGNLRKRELYAAANPPLVLAVEPDGIPAEMQFERRWIVWRLDWRADRRGGGKWTKTPYQPSGRNASSTDPSTWSNFADALTAYATGEFSGIGFVLGD